MFRLLPLVFSGLIMPFFVQAAVYKSIDDQGNIYFSDEPSKGAEEVPLSEMQTYQPAPLPPPAASSGSSQQSVIKEQTEYQVAIVEPVSDATIRNNEGSLDVSIVLNQPLMSGDDIRLLLDDTPVKEYGVSVQRSEDGSEFALQGISPGTHTLRAQVVSNSGQVLARSEIVSFNLLRFTIHH